MQPDPDQKPDSRRKMRWKKFMRIASICSAIIIAGFLWIGFIVLVFLNRGLPSVESLKNYEPKEVSQVFAEHGEVIGEFFEEKRIVRRDIPVQVKQAFMAAEDSNFYFHQGVDFFGMLRAAYVNIMAGGIRQGASTITQQVARAFLLSSERTFERKIREIILAWQIENSLTKDEILFLYLNHIFLGAGSYGVGAAAQIYFGKDLNEITLAEAAILAGLPKAPSKYSPQKNPMRVKRRQLYVLKQMYENNFISKQEYEEAAAQDVFVEPPKNINQTIAPYFVETIRQQLMEEYGSTRVLEDGLRIYTTLDLEKQKAAQNALRKGLSELEKRQGYRGPLRHTTREEYFRGREFVKDDGSSRDSEAEVSLEEAKNKGNILMRPPKAAEPGDFMEGIVSSVDDGKGEVFVEFDPGHFARMSFETMRWAHKRVAASEEDEEEIEIQAVNTPSDVLRKGDVVLISVVSVPSARGLPLEAQLEQHTMVEGALLSIDPQNGFMKSMVGGYDFARSQFNRAIQAKRQPGSAFKPIIYAAALDLGFTAASLIQDIPITFENAADEEKWRPANYDQKFLGDVTLRSSLLASRNIPTIRLLNEVGLDTVINYARRTGITSPLQRDFTLALGSSVTTLEEIMRPYVVFSNGGYTKKVYLIKRVTDRHGALLKENVLENYETDSIATIQSSVAELKKEIAGVVFKGSAEPEEAQGESFLRDTKSDAKRELKVITSPLKAGQVLSTETSFLMTHLLKENVLYGTGKRAKELQRPASGKTGTTDQNRDAWFIGYTPELVTGVWVGFDDLRVLGRAETGSRAAVPIWLDFMVKATAPYPISDFEVPATIEFARVNPKLGTLAGPQERSATFEAFVKGTAPTQTTQPVMKDSDLYLRDR
jgi:penicillin-binding protein 1A